MPTNKKRTRTVDLRAEDAARLDKLKRHFDKGSPVPVREIDVMRLAFQEACVALGLEQRPSSTVEPIEGTS